MLSRQSAKNPVYRGILASFEEIAGVDLQYLQPRARLGHQSVHFVMVSYIRLIKVESPGIRVRPSLLTIAMEIFALFLPHVVVVWWAGLVFIPIARLGGLCRMPTCGIP